MVSKETSIEKITEFLGYTPQIRYPNGWKGSTTIIELYCPTHGWYEKSALLASKQKCPKCSNREKFDSRIIPIEDYIRRIEENFGYSPIMELKGEYVGFKTPIRINCPTHGWYDTKLGTARKCKKCTQIERAKNATTTPEDAIKKITENLGYTPNVKFPKNLSGIKDTVEIECPKHGWYSQQLSNAYKYGCPICGRESRVEKIKTPREDVIKDITLNLGYTPNIKFPKNWGGVVDKIEIECPRHGWYTQTALIAYHSKCPICASEDRMKARGRRYVYKGEKFDSKWEIYVSAYFEEHGIDFEREKKVDYLLNGHPRTYYCDFYLTETNKYVEVKGSQFFTEDGTLESPWKKGVDKELFNEQSEASKVKHSKAKELGAIYITKIDGVPKSWFQYNEGVQMEDISKYQSWFYEHHTDLDISVWEKDN